MFETIETFYINVEKPPMTFVRELGGLSRVHLMEPKHPTMCEQPKYYYLVYVGALVCQWIDRVLSMC